MILVFPLSILGAMLLFVSIELISQTKHVTTNRDMSVSIVTAVVAVIIGMLPGVIFGLGLIKILGMRNKSNIRSDSELSISN